MKTIIYLALSLILTAPYRAFAQQTVDAPRGAYGDEILKAVDPFVEQSGLYGENSRVGGLWSSPASGSECEITINGKFLFIARPGSAPDHFLWRVDLRDFTSLKDGSYFSEYFEVKNPYSVCKGDWVSARYELKIDLQKRRVDFIQSGRCQWAFQDNPMTDYYEAATCGEFRERD